MKKIEELVEIEVGNVIHRVRVVELGFSDNSGSARKATLEENKEGKSVHVQEDSLSDSLSESSRSRPSEMVAGSKLQVEDETLNTCVIGKERNKSEAANDFGSSRFLGESDLKSNENNVVIPSNNVISSGEGKLGVEQEKCIPDSSNDKEKGRAEKTTNGRIEDMAQEVVMVGLDNNPISWADIVSNNLKGHNDGNYLDPTMACNQIVGGAIAVEKPSYFPSSTGPSLAQNPIMAEENIEYDSVEPSVEYDLDALEFAIVGGTLFEFGVGSFLQSGHGNKDDQKLSFHHVDCVNSGGCRFHGKESVGLRGSAGVRQGVECCELSGYDPVAAVVLFVLLCWRLGDSNRAALYYKFLV
ncbi:hypothetical protein V6N13_121398 [Hibiscus sabdariffa]